MDKNNKKIEDNKRMIKEEKKKIKSLKRDIRNIKKNKFKKTKFGKFLKRTTGFFSDERNTYSFSEVFVITLISLVLGVLVVAGLNMIVYTMGFYTYNEQGIGSILNSIMEVLSGGLVPVVLLPKVIQKATYYLPFRLVSDLPFRIYTNNLGISEGILGIGLQMIWIVILIIVGDLIVKKSLGRVFVQGG